MLCASGISEEVQKARGYFSAIKRLDLQRLGFSVAQSQCVPAMAIPLRRPDGQPGPYQIRPDSPRHFADGREAKYESASGERVCLDVPPTVRMHIGNPHIPLFITEGIKKG